MRDLTLAEDFDWTLQVFGERDLFIDNLLVRIHRCFWWTVLAPWEFEFPFPGSLISTFLGLHPSPAWEVDLAAEGSLLCGEEMLTVRRKEVDFEAKGS